MVLAALGIFVAETTGRASLGIAVFCLKFGLGRLKTAFWLLRTDPNRGRARVCFLFYLGSALARIVVASVLFLILHNIITNRFFPIKAGGLGRPIIDDLSVETFDFVIALAPWFVVEIFAIAASIVCKIKVWVGDEADRARDRDIWPPSYLNDDVESASRNFATLPIYILSILIIMILFLLLIMACVSLAEVARIHQVHLFFTVAGMIFSVVIFATSACKIVEKITILVPAGSPQSCWEGEKSVQISEFPPDAEDQYEGISQDYHNYF